MLIQRGNAVNKLFLYVCLLKLEAISFRKYVFDNLEGLHNIWKKHGYITNSKFLERWVITQAGLII